MFYSDNESYGQEPTREDTEQGGDNTNSNGKYTHFPTKTTLMFMRGIEINYFHHKNIHFLLGLTPTMASWKHLMWHSWVLRAEQKNKIQTQPRVENWERDLTLFLSITIIHLML